jgi:hypothetical protein
MATLINRVLARDPKRRLVLVQKPQGALAWHYEMERWRNSPGYNEAPIISCLNCSVTVEFVPVVPKRRRAA